MDFRDLIPFGRDRGNVPVQRDRGEHPMDTFQREFNRLFDDFFRTPTMFGRGGEAFASMPRVDASESEGEYGVTAELPTADGQAARPGLNASTARQGASFSPSTRRRSSARPPQFLIRPSFLPA